MFTFTYGGFGFVANPPEGAYFVLNLMAIGLKTVSSEFHKMFSYFNVHFFKSLQISSQKHQP
jgi:hypothetical protein